MRKFFKKIGKKIKKIGKEIGKPFKKLMKTKIGKIIGTIGMMMIGGWMMAGAKSFVGTMWAGEGMAAAFGEGISAMGTAAKASYTTITEGVKGMFTKNGTMTVKEGANNLKDKVVKKAGSPVDFASDAVVSGGQAPDIIGNQIASMPPPTDVSGQALKTTTDGSILAEGAETVSGNIVGTDIKAGRIGEIAAKPTTSLLDPKGVDFSTDLSSTIKPDLTSTGKIINPVDTKKLSWAQRNMPRVADVFESSKTLTDVGDQFMEFKPFKNVEALPKFVRNTDLAEVKAISSVLQKPKEPYFGSSDMTGAYAALDVNAQRLYAGNTPSMAELGDGRTSVPSPSVIGAADYFNNTRKAGFIWDTSLLTVNPSKIVT